MDSVGFSGPAVEALSNIFKARNYLFILPSFYTSIAELTHVFPAGCLSTWPVLYEGNCPCNPRSASPMSSLKPDPARCFARTIGFTAQDTEPGQNLVPPAALGCRRRGEDPLFMHLSVSNYQTVYQYHCSDPSQLYLALANIRQGG